MGTRSLIRKEAKEAKSSTYTGGKMCQKGHPSLRFTSTGSCVECSYEHRKNYGINQQGKLKEYRKKRHMDKREILNEKTRDWHRNNPKRSYMIAARKRAKDQGVPFDLTEEDIVFPEVCPVLGIPIKLEHTDGPRKRTDNTPSLDRIIPVLGYVRGNVEMISWRANRLKNDASMYEIEKILDYMRRTRFPLWKW